MIYLRTGSHVQEMVCMVRLGDVEIALEYAEQQQCDVTQLAQVYLLTISGYISFFIRFNQGRF